MRDDEFNVRAETEVAPLAGREIVGAAEGAVVLELHVADGEALGGRSSPLRLSLPAEAAVHLARERDRQARRELCARLRRQLRAGVARGDGAGTMRGAR